MQGKNVLLEVVRAPLDDDLWAAVLDEAILMGDQDELVTIRRRLAYGAWLVSVVHPRDLRWRPIHHKAEPVQLELDATVLKTLQAFADQCGYGLAVVIATILIDDACRPPEVIAVERRMSADEPRSLRWERGRGHIYPVYFEVPGYQLVFLRLLSRWPVKRDDVFDEALMALARQVQHVDQIAGLQVSDEARAFARKMVHWPK